MPGLTIRFETPAGMTSTGRMILDGDIDDSTAGDFQRSLNAARQGKTNRFILDLRGVRYINSSGFSGLTGFSEALAHEGGEVVLVGTQQKVRLVLDMLGLSDRFKSFLTMDDAVDYLKRMPAPAPSSAEGGRASGAGAGPSVPASQKPPALVPKPSPTASTSEPRLTSSVHGIPAQLSIGLSPAGIAGASALAGGLAREAGWAAADIERAVRDILETVLRVAYHGHPGHICHLLVHGSREKFEIRCIHYGDKIGFKPDDKERAELFHTARTVLDRFELQPLQGSGNIITAVRTKI